jgi:hypothetical protein
MNQSVSPSPVGSLANLRQLRWYYLLLLFAVVGVVVANVLKILTPPPLAVPETPLLTQQLNDVQPVFRNLNFTGQAPTFPSSLTVATYQPSSAATTDLLTPLITKYSLTPHPAVPNLWSSSTQSLFWRTSTNVVELSLITPTTIEASGPFPTSEAVNTTAQFITDNLPFLNGVVPLSDKVIHFSGDFELVRTTNLNEATQMVIPFAYQIEGLPVMVGTTSSFPAEVFIDRNRTILKIIFSPVPLSYTLTPAQRVISLDEAVANINNQKGTIIGYNLESGTDISLGQIQQGELTQVIMEYRLDPTSNLIYPFYHFAGKVQTPSGETALEVITPAIVTTNQLR